MHPRSLSLELKWIARKDEMAADAPDKNKAWVPPERKSLDELAFRTTFRVMPGAKPNSTRHGLSAAPREEPLLSG
jgi:hypothetical protein